ncbi:NERD domain-containing protein [Adlercreutzia muris]|uniref:NERD domain-containing protein n=1 Tax=Adlercreutzia muris TaxID=1796610 RepID=UPI003516B7DC
MLEVRYGTAARSHENIFFRRFAQSLKNYFDSHGIDGLLSGFPICRVREDLQIDALLITSRTMVIIDFKDYSGTLTLPNEANFKKGAWKMSNGLTVKGGSSPNPFYQLGLQRDRLSGILRMTAKNLTQFNPRHISTIVCFTEPIEIDGSIPGKFKLSFFIASSESYLERLFDIINVEEDSSDLLNNDFLKFLNSKLFESNPYDCFIVPEKIQEKSSEAAIADIEDSSTVLDSDIWNQATRFMEGDGDVLIVTGTVGSGKHSIAERLRESAYAAGFTSARLFALSNRVKNNLMASIEEVESLYATIYDFSKKEIDDQTGREIVPLAPFSPVEAFKDLEPQERDEELRSIFIVYESQMVTNTYRDEGTVRFGSGELLKDILDYLSISTSKTNKVVFVGDKFQLGFGSWSQSSLNPDAYQNSIAVTTIDLPDTKNPNGIERVCLGIADRIRAESYSELAIVPNEMVELKSKQSEKALIEEVTSNWATHKIVAYSNKRCHDLNSYIKRSIIQNGMQLAPGDLVIFNNQVFAYPVTSAPGQVLAFDGDEPIRIENGTFGIVQEVGSPALSRSYSFESLAEPVTLSLAQAVVKLESGICVTTEVLTEYLYSEKAALSDYEERAVQILLRELLASAERNYPFAPGDPDFDEMTATGDYIKTEDGRYRDKNDARRLTIYEKRYREKIARRLASDPSSEYRRWQNAARIKYGWCITVHKAMSYKWPHVVFATTYEQGRSNREYFKFIYTGISRASESICLVRWENLSPFSETVFIRKATGTSRRKRAVVATTGGSTPAVVVKKLLDRSLDEAAEIASMESKNYLEIAQIKYGELCAKIGFDYNGKGEIYSPRLLTGDPQILEALTTYLAPR